MCHLPFLHHSKLVIQTLVSHEHSSLISPPLERDAEATRGGRNEDDVHGSLTRSSESTHPYPQIWVNLKVNLNLVDLYVA